MLGDGDLGNVLDRLEHVDVAESFLAQPTHAPVQLAPLLAKD